MIRLILERMVGSLSGFAALGKYKEAHDLDYCVPARRLRWLVFKEKMRNRRRRKNGTKKTLLSERC